MRKFLSLVLALIVAMLPVCALSEAAATPSPEAEVTAAPEAAPAEATEAPALTPAPDPNKVVASIDGDNILYSDVENYFNMIASQYSAYMDVNDPSIRPLLMDQALNYATQIMLMEHKAAELSLDKLSEEDIAGIQKKAEDDYNSYLTSYVDYLKQTGVAEDEAKKQAEEYMASYDFTPDKIAEQYRLSEVLTRLQKSITDPVQVTDEQVKTAFDEKVAGEKASYDANPASYCDAKLNGGTVYYAPAGVRTVKHILIKPEKIDEINHLKAKIADAATAEADKKDAQTQLDALLKEAQPKVDEVVAKIKAGEDFQGLIDAYGEDPGMKAGSDTAGTGYYVSEGASFDEAFLKAAMALEKVGDVSDPVLGTYGYHIIRYEADVTTGPTTFDAVKEAITSEALKTAQSEAFTKALDDWKAAAKIETFES